MAKRGTEIYKLKEEYKTFEQWTSVRDTIYDIDNMDANLNFRMFLSVMDPITKTTSDGEQEFSLIDEIFVILIEACNSEEDETIENNWFSKHKEQRLPSFCLDDKTYTDKDEDSPEGKLVRDLKGVKDEKTAFEKVLSFLNSYSTEAWVKLIPI